MSETKAATAFVGLGVMGYPMAGHLTRNGFEVTVFNRTGAKAEQWLEEHGGGSVRTALAGTPAEAAANADVVFLCVGNDDDVRSVVHDVIRHRLILSYEANAEGITANQVIDEIVKQVAVA